MPEGFIDYLRSLCVTLYRTMQSPFHPFIHNKSTIVDMDGVLEDVSLAGDSRLLNHARIIEILQQIDTVNGIGYRGYVIL